MRDLAARADRALDHRRASHHALVEHDGHVVLHVLARLVLEAAAALVAQLELRRSLPSIGRLVRLARRSRYSPVMIGRASSDVQRAVAPGRSTTSESAPQRSTLPGGSAAWTSGIVEVAAARRPDVGSRDDVLPGHLPPLDCTSCENAPRGRLRGARAVGLARPCRVAAPRRSSSRCPVPPSAATSSARLPARSSRVAGARRGTERGALRLGDRVEARQRPSRAPASCR